MDHSTDESTDEVELLALGQQLVQAASEVRRGIDAVTELGELPPAVHWDLVVPHDPIAAINVPHQHPMLVGLLPDPADVDAYASWWGVKTCSRTPSWRGARTVVYATAPVGVEVWALVEPTGEAPDA